MPTATVSPPLQPNQINPVRPLTASDLYARSQGEINEGPELCHWCTSPCERILTHDEPRPTPFIKTKTTAARPNSAFICRGCWLWRRARLTVQFTDGKLKDSQTPANWSWLITDHEVKSPVLGRLEIYRTLIRPPARFVLALLDGPGPNLLHLAVANDYSTRDLLNDSPIKFTLNNVAHTYTVFELEHALKTGNTEGMMPGVGALVRLFGLPPKEETAEEKVKRGSGRPSTKERSKPGQAV